MNTFFLFKKLASTLLMPLQFSLALIVLGTVFLWLKRGQRLAKCLVTLGAGLLLIFSNSFIGYHLVHELEAKYPPLLLARPGKERDSAVPHLLTDGKTGGAYPRLGKDPLIVVLSGGASDDRELPMTLRLPPDSAFRVVEAVKIYRSLTSSTDGAADTGEASAKGIPTPPGTPRILMSGGPTVNKVAEAVPMEKLAESLGVPANAILMETCSDDTASEAKDVLPFAGHQPFVLVTSAFHMPRAMALFQHLGMRPIPAPSNYMGQWTTKPFVMNLPPNAGAIVQSTAAWHEHLGMFWEHLRGQL